MGVDGKIILLVEDEAIIALTNKSSLEKYGYKVITVNSGEKAIEIVKASNDIDLILMDIDLGAGIDGTETASIILKDRNIPVVFLSSHTEPIIVERTEKITSYGYVVKSSSITVLDASIKMAFKLFYANRKIIESESAVRARLNAILEPDGDIGVLSLFDIIDYEAIRDLMGEFYRITQIGIGILDINGNVLVAFGWQDICTEFHRKHPETLKNCIESDVVLSSGVTAGSCKTYKCKNGLWEVMTPIEIDGKHMGNICLGQFFYDDEIPDYDLFRNKARQFGFDEEEYIKAIERVRRWSRETVDATMLFYAKFSRLISSMSYSSVKLSRALFQNEISLKKLAESGEKQLTMISNISDVIGIIGVDGIMKYKSPNITKWFGWEPEDLVGTDGWLTVHQDDLERIKKIFNTLIEKDNLYVTVEYKYKCKDGSYKPIELTATNLVNNPIICGVLLNYHDITDRKLVKESLRESEEKYRLLHENAGIGIGYYKPDGTIISYNNVAAKHMNGRPEDFIGKSIFDLFSKDEADFYYDRIKKSILSDNPIIYEDMVPLPSGDIYFLSTFTKIVDTSNNITGIQIISQDITERKLAEAEIKIKNEELKAVNEEMTAALKEMESTNEELITISEEMEKQDKALRESEIKYRKIYENTQDVLYQIDNKGIIAELSPSIKKYSGYSREEFIGTSVENIYFDKSEREEFLKTLIENGEVNDYELHLKNKNEKEVIASANSHIIFNSAGEFNGVEGSLRDITERKQLEKKLKLSEENYRTFINSTDDMAFIKNEKFQYIMINSTYQKYFGKSEQEILGKTDFELMPGVVAKNCLYSDTRALKQNEVFISVESIDDYIYETKKFPVMLQDSKIGIGGFIRDMTKSKLAEEKIKKLLNEKELILKEVHHRIKNFMNSIKGLILLQADSLKNPIAISALQDFESRIKSMMLLYNKLYDSEQYDEISVYAYVPLLVDEVIATFPNSSSVKVEKNIDDFVLDSKTMQPLGIIINELLTNVMKYAFIDRSDGLITVTATLKNNHVTIIVADNGKGIPEKISFENSSGFGMQLVSMLTEQIGGSIGIERGQGTKFVLEFKVLKRKI